MIFNECNEYTSKKQINNERFKIFFRYMFMYDTNLILHEVKK